MLGALAEVLMRKEYTVEFRYPKQEIAGIEFDWKNNTVKIPSDDFCCCITFEMAGAKCFHLI